MTNCFSYMTATGSGPEASTQGHKHKAFQRPLVQPEHPPNDLHPVLQGHTKSLGTHHEAGSELCLKAGLDTTVKLPHQKNGKPESPKDKAPSLHTLLLHMPCMP